MTHTRGAQHHTMTQGKIERYHRSMKLENIYFGTHSFDDIHFFEMRILDQLNCSTFNHPMSFVYSYEIQMKLMIANLCD